MNKLISKLVVSILASFVLLLSFAPVAFAQASITGTGPWYNQTPQQWIGKVFGGDQNEIFGERYTYAQTQWIAYSIFILVFNASTGGHLSGCLATFGTGNVGDCANDIKNVLSTIPNLASANDSKTNVMAEIFTADRPLSGITYVRNIGRKLNIIPQAHAQAAGVGFGYNALTFNGGAAAIGDLWTTIRDLAYGIFVLVIIAFAFMIMFRVKISPQVVVSVQSALPKIAIGLVLVTFSFAIAGFLVDLMYVVIGIVSLIFSRIPIYGIGQSGVAGISVQAYFDMLTKGPAFLGGGSGILGLMLMYWGNFFMAFFTIGFGSIFAGIGCIPAFAQLGGSLLGVVLLILMLIALLVLIVVVVWNFFRTIWLLAKTFLIFILLVIFAPLILTAGVIMPGMGFGNWIKQLAAKLAVYPIVGVMFILSLLLLQQAQSVIGLTLHSCSTWPAGWPPFMGGSPQMVALLFVVASLAVFVMIPKAGDVAEGFFSGKFAFGNAIGEVTRPFGIGVRAVGTGVQLADTGLDALVALGLLNQAGNAPAAGAVGRVIRRARGGGGPAGAPPVPPTP